jgi:hypothetical protein
MDAPLDKVPSRWRSAWPVVTAGQEGGTDEEKLEEAYDVPGGCRHGNLAVSAC